MTDASPEPAAGAPHDPDEAQEQRLHPLSWVFVLIAQLKQFILPLLVLVFAGRGDRNELWGLVAVGVLVVYALLEYLTYRYRLLPDAIAIRSGWLHRNRREIPYARIHNVNLHQSLLHRLAGVAEVRLESAGGSKPEAQMRVLRLDQAEALEALVRQRGKAAHAPASASTSTPAAQAGIDARPHASATLLQLSNGELVRLGLISNRGLLVVAATFGVLAQAGEQMRGALLERWGKLAYGWLTDTVGQHAHDGALALGIAAASLLLVALALLRLLSVALALLQYHGFTLRDDGTRITVERGLLTRTRTSARRRRVQVWSLHESLLHRLFRRRSLQVQTAAAVRGGEHEARALKELAPIATPTQCDALLQHFLADAGLPDAGVTALDWQPLHPAAWWRIAVPGVLLVLTVAAALCWRFGGIGLLALLLLPLQGWRAYRIAAGSGWACNGRVVAVRRGWLDRHWTIAQAGKIQALRLAQSPLDRACGMASLLLDTAGSPPLSAPLQLRYLSLASARALSARLGRAPGRLPLQG